MKPVISVVIPIYNTSSYLRKCLDSLISQTLENIEIICIDDVSPDDSSKIVQEYVAKDDRVRLIRHKINKGQGGARNTGILSAKSDFIASVDSDDSVAPNMLQRLWESSEFGKFDVTCCSFARVSSSGEEITKRTFHPRVIDNSKNVINIFTVSNPAIWNKLWRKSLFIDNDIFFPEKLYYQDMATIPLLLSKANTVCFIDDCLYYYLVRDGSVTTSYSPKHIIDYFKVYEILYESLEKFDLVDRYLKELRDNISEGMRFHSNNVIQSSMSNSEINQYLRHMLMMKVSFMELHRSLKDMTQEDLLNDLRSTTKFSELQCYIEKKPTNEATLELSNINSLDTSIYTSESKQKLSIFQKSGIKVFGLLFKPFILPRQMKKLNEQPDAFFKDSQNNFTQFCGKLLKLL